MVGSYSSILRRRLPLLIVLTLVLASLAFLFLTQRAPSYRSVALIEVSSGSVADSVVGIDRSYEEPERRVATQIEVLESRRIADAAAGILLREGVDLDPVEVATRVEAVPKGASNYIEVAGTGTDPQSAQQVTEAVVAAYAEVRRSEQQQELEQLQAELQEAIAVAEAELAQLSSAEAGAATERQRTAAAERLRTAVELLESVRLRSSIETNAVRLLSEPSLPEQPEGQLSASAALVVAVFGAYCLAIAIVFGTEIWKDAVRTRKEVEQVVSAVTLTDMPPSEDEQDVFAAPDGARAVAARNLRLRLSSFFQGRVPPRVLLTATTSDADEVLAVASALAASCAHSGLRVCIVGDTGRRATDDPARGVLSTVVSAQPFPGLTDVWMIPATVGTPASAAVFDTEQPDSVLDELGASFDVMLFAVTEAGKVAAVAVAPFVDATAVVVVLGRTQGRPLLRFVESLRQTGAIVHGLVVVEGAGRRKRGGRAKPDTSPVTPASSTDVKSTEPSTSGKDRKDRRGRKAAAKAEEAAAKAAAASAQAPRAPREEVARAHEAPARAVVQTPVQSPVRTSVEVLDEGRTEPPVSTAAASSLLTSPPPLEEPDVGEVSDQPDRSSVLEDAAPDEDTVLLEDTVLHEDAPQPGPAPLPAVRGSAGVPATDRADLGWPDQGHAPSDEDVPAHTAVGAGWPDAVEEQGRGVPLRRS